MSRERWWKCSPSSNSNFSGGNMKIPFYFPLNLFLWFTWRYYVNNPRAFLSPPRHISHYCSGLTRNCILRESWIEFKSFSPPHRQQSKSAFRRYQKTSSSHCLPLMCFPPKLNMPTPTPFSRPRDDVKMWWRRKRMSSPGSLTPVSHITIIHTPFLI